ncbi:MAG: CapA family protein [Gemmatimonadota bacterium]|nr:CapA family protein [Gemmatimonadota bacterium]
MDAPTTLFLAGDVMTGRGIDQVLPHSVDPTLHEPYVKDARTYVRIAEEAGASIPERVAFDYVWGSALEELEALAPDVRVVNLETAVTTHGEPWPDKAIHYRMHPQNAPLLTAVGLDAVVLANNHVLDWGREGLRETLRSVLDAGIATCGAGEDEEDAGNPVVLDTPGGRILLFAYASPTAGVFPAWEAGPERPGVSFLETLDPSGADRVAEDVAARRRETDRVVVSVHWGGNWGYEIPEDERLFARRLVEHGAADVVYGHSSHHPKGMEVHEGRLILYGAGDFLNDYEGIGGHEEYRGSLTLMYFPRLAPSGTLEELVMTPMRIRDFRLQRPDREERRWLAGTLNRESRPWGGGVEEEDGRLRFRWG